jgi:hypothetical protein
MAAPWEQCRGESAKAYAAFCLYRDLGPRRSIDEASRRYHGREPSGGNGPQARRSREASGLIRRWATRWDWAARARAWDQELASANAGKQLEAVKEMAERHAREAMLLQNKAVERLRQLRPEELKPRDTLAYLVEAAKLERLARGEPTERIAEEHHFPDVKELTDDELARIVAGGPGRLSPPGGRGAVPQADGPQEPV